MAATDGSGGKFGAPLNLLVNNGCVLVTADGRVLARAAGLGSAEECLKQGLKKWMELPEAVRRPGALKVPSLKERPFLAPADPPPGGLVLKVHTRNLKRDERGELARVTARDLRDKAKYPNWDVAYTEPARDNLWLTEAEWRALIPATPRKGDRKAVPAAVRDRIFLFHLADTTHGDTFAWGRQNLRSGELTLTVVETEPALRLRLDGAAHLAETPDVKVARGFEARFEGYLDYDPRTKGVLGFSFVALGECWGGGRGSNRFARPGRTPLAVAFDLVRPGKGVDRIAPIGYVGYHGTGYKGPYFAAGK
jgi:hypothetical protein